MKFILIFLMLVGVAQAKPYWGENKNAFFRAKESCEKHNKSTCFEYDSNVCKKEYCDYTEEGFVINSEAKNLYDSKALAKSDSVDKKDLALKVIKSWDCSTKVGDMKAICRVLKGLAHNQ